MVTNEQRFDSLGANSRGGGSAGSACLYLSLRAESARLFPVLAAGVGCLYAALCGEGVGILPWSDGAIIPFEFVAISGDGDLHPHFDSPDEGTLSIEGVRHRNSADRRVTCI